MKYLVLTFCSVALLMACTPKISEAIDSVEDAADDTVEGAVDVTEQTAEDARIGADLAQGKVIFFRDCGRCHYGGHPTIESYTREQWSNILPRMTKNAELNEEETRQVTAYVNWEVDNG